ncbi:MAG: PPOX class F420-dependent oxidoreductase [Actinomycetia bacterium]|nr:PPOX class F420-dependent oxidoreductase [Actinomycetes bacterium]
MSNLIPAALRDLLDAPIVAALATILPDGQPQVTPVWCSYDGTHVVVNATADRQKHRNMVERPRVTLMVVDPDNQFRYVEIRGIVDEITAEGGGESMDSLSLLYTGQHKRYGIEAPPRDESERLLYKILPVRVSFNPLTR